MENLGESANRPATGSGNTQFERKILVIFGLLCLFVTGALVLFPSFWQALANPYETMTAAMATIAEICRW